MHKTLVLTKGQWEKLRKEGSVTMRRKRDIFTIETPQASKERRTEQVNRVKGALQQLTATFGRDIVATASSTLKLTPVPVQKNGKLRKKRGPKGNKGYMDKVLHLIPKSAFGWLEQNHKEAVRLIEAHEWKKIVPQFHIGDIVELARPMTAVSMQASFKKHGMKAKTRFLKDRVVLTRIA